MQHQGQPGPQGKEAGTGSGSEPHIPSRQSQMQRAASSLVWAAGNARHTVGGLQGSLQVRAATCLQKAWPRAAEAGPARGPGPGVLGL